jgi:hypothetical protein
MVDLLSIMERPMVATVISALIGFGIAAMFRPLCKGPECVILRGPPVNEIRNSVYQFGSKCIEFQTRAVECPKKVSSVPVVDAISFAEVSQ